MNKKSRFAGQNQSSIIDRLNGVSSGGFGKFYLEDKSAKQLLHSLHNSCAHYNDYISPLNENEVTYNKKYVQDSEQSK